MPKRGTLGSERVVCVKFLRDGTPFAAKRLKKVGEEGAFGARKKMVRTFRTVRLGGYAPGADRGFLVSVSSISLSCGAVTSANCSACFQCSVVDSEREVWQGPFIKLRRI